MSDGWWLDACCNTGSDQAKNAADGESSGEVAHVTQASSEDRTSNATDAIGQEDQWIELGDVLGSKSIRRDGWEQGKVAAEIESDQDGTKVEQRWRASHFRKGDHENTLGGTHDDDGNLSTERVGQAAPGDAAEAVGQ